MAFVGFLLTLATGLFLLCGAITAAVIMRGLSGREPPPYVLLVGTFGAALVCLAITHAPFTLAWVR